MRLVLSDTSSVRSGLPKKRFRACALPGSEACGATVCAPPFEDVSVSGGEGGGALVDTHVQPLALIADGHGVCTTNIPLAAAARTHTKGAADND